MVCKKTYASSFKAAIAAEGASIKYRIESEYLSKLGIFMSLLFFVDFAFAFMFSKQAVKT